MLRAVLDTNVLISAIISDGKSRELLKKAITRQFQIVTSDLILTELATVLCRPKFKTSKEKIGRIIFALKRTADVVVVKSKLEVVKEDPNDDMLIETVLGWESPINCDRRQPSFSAQELRANQNSDD